MYDQPTTFSSFSPHWPSPQECLFFTHVPLCFFFVLTWIIITFISFYACLRPFFFSFKFLVSFVCFKIIYPLTKNNTKGISGQFVFHKFFIVMKWREFISRIILSDLLFFFFSLLSMKLYLKKNHLEWVGIKLLMEKIYMYRKCWK